MLTLLYEIGYELGSKLAEIVGPYIIDRFY